MMHLSYLRNETYGPHEHVNPFLSPYIKSVILIVVFHLHLFANVLQYHVNMYNYKHDSCNRSSLHLMTV